MTNEQFRPVSGLHHISLNTGDIDAAVRFYTLVLGFSKKLEWQDGARRAVMLACGGVCLEFFSDTGSKAGHEGPVAHFALRTDDCAAAAECVRKAGMKITLEPKDVRLGGEDSLPARVAFFIGPDGETVELFEER